MDAVVFRELDCTTIPANRLAVQDWQISILDSSGVVKPAFADFTVTSVNNTSALLNWSTISEAAVASFVVEHSVDSVMYITLTTVAAGSGNANEYSYTDASPETGANYYRIRMVDSGGNTIVISPLRSAVFTRYTGSIAIVPNPAVSRATILLDAAFNASQLLMFDMQGRTVHSAVLSAGLTSYPINTAQLGAGIYLVKVISGKR